MASVSPDLKYVSVVVVEIGVRAKDATRRLEIAWLEGLEGRVRHLDLAAGPVAALDDSVEAVERFSGRRD